MSDTHSIRCASETDGNAAKMRKLEKEFALIAAAPDLLKACQECLKQDEWSGTGLSSQNLILLRKAVAKATS